FDDFGRIIQNQEKNMVTEEVWASATIYDKFGRPAINTLSAPTGKDRIEYQSNFVRNTSGQAYGPSDFDGNKLNSPNAVGEQLNTLGWWYSTQNNREDWQPTTNFPYIRKDYSDLTGEVRRTTVPGDAMHLGTGRAKKSFTMPAGTELSYVFGPYSPLCRLAGLSSYDDGTLSNQCSSIGFIPRYIKKVTKDPDGRETVIFYDVNGNEVAHALAGDPTSAATTELRQTYFNVPKSSFQDIHVSQRSSESTPINFSGSGMNYSIYDLETDLPVVLNSSSASRSLAAGFYRVVNNNSSNPLLFDYQLNYQDYSLYIYDKSNRQVASVAPNDVVYTIVSSPGSNHKAFTLYRHNSIGQLVWEQSPDGGRIEYFYDRKGRLRFTIDDDQDSQNRYTYYKYDIAGRVVETGESFPQPSNLSSLANSSSHPSSGNSQVTYRRYDEIDGSFPLAYGQKYVSGRLAKTWNDSETIWYSYDEQGRYEWVARRITNGPGAKITLYQYDLRGDVTSTTYQPNQDDEISQQYAYDIGSRITGGATRRDDGVNNAPMNQAQYTYTPDGDLEKIVTGGGLETQTFAYTIRGALKAINPGDMRVTDINGGEHHPFSMALHYYLNDFESANGQWKDTRALPSTSANSPYNNYAGNIVASRWKTRAEVGSTDFSGHFAYRYRYNKRNELYQAYFANITPYSTSIYEGKANFISDYYNYFTYDRNGNILKQRRYAANISMCSGNSIFMDNLTYRYDYTGGKNRLTHIDDGYTNSCIRGELTDQFSNNYLYNAKGQLIRDLQANQYLEYDTYGRVRRVRNGTTNLSPLKAEYSYGPDGKRVRKRVYNGSSYYDTWYVHDNGSLKGVYEANNTCPGCNIPTLMEIPVYGSSRVGLALRDGASWTYHYELKDHLGNVRVVLKEGDNGTQDIVRYADYYPYGWALPGRNGGMSYRYAYQSQYAELDGETNWLAFEKRSFDTRVGRWMTIDPEEQFYSPYLAMANSPVNALDRDGAFVPLLTGLAGGIIAGGWSLISSGGKDWKGAAASFAGGFVAGAVAGTGLGLVGLAGTGTFATTATAVAAGAKALGFTGTFYITTFTSLVGSGIGAVARQGVRVGFGEEFNEYDIVYSMALAIPSGVLAQIPKGFNTAVKRSAQQATAREGGRQFIRKQFRETVKELRNSIRKQSGHRITKKEAEVLAIQALSIAKAAEASSIGVNVRVTQESIKIIASFTTGALTTETREVLLKDTNQQSQPQAPGNEGN
ncbi:MAG: RHS repeat-associated core domain-containing protein, partial [Bacteroidota bacterium]